MHRRDFLEAMIAASLAATCRAQQASPTKLGIPGPYRGRVVSVSHPACIISDAYQAEPIQQMMRKGMMELTGAPSWAEAWRVFFEPGDVVGIKLNPVGKPHAISAPEVLQQIIDGLKQAGVKPKDIVVFDRYRQPFLEAGMDKWVPEGVRWSWASEQYDELQLGMDGYDPDVYMELPLIQAGQDARDPHVRRSYVARFLTKEVNKLINVPVLKHHYVSGVTLALKNLSHGLVNNVNRSHSTSKLNATAVFIPAVVDLPVFRQKVVLHILDGVKGVFRGGPFGENPQYVWEHRTMYFATDPVALDKIGSRAIDEKRIEKGLPPVARSYWNEDESLVHCQPEHIEIAGALGLGESDEKKIEWRKVGLK